MDEFRLVDAVDCERVVMAIADAVDGGPDAGLGEMLGVANTDVVCGFKPVVATPRDWSL